MASYTHFPDGFQLEDYLAAEYPPRARARMRGVQSTGASTVLKELVCSIQAGRGILPPHRLICNMKNVQAALALLSPSNALRPLLEKLQGANDAYLDHLKIDNVLGRLSKASMEAHHVSSMLFFCRNPIDPIPVPWMLRDSMISFLGVGDRITDLIGNLGTNADNIAGCIIPGRKFNGNVYRGGVLKRIHDDRGLIFGAWQGKTEKVPVYEEYENGQRVSHYEDKHVPYTMTDADNRKLASMGKDVDEVVGLINKTMHTENNVKGAVSMGGSNPYEDGLMPFNTGMGMIYNADEDTLSGIMGKAARLASLAESSEEGRTATGDFVLEGIKGTSKEGTKSTILDLLVPEPVAKIIRRERVKQVHATGKEVIRNYCGDAVGTREVEVLGGAQGSSREAASDPLPERKAPEPNLDTMRGDSSPSPESPRWDRGRLLSPCSPKGRPSPPRRGSCPGGRRSCSRIPKPQWSLRERSAGSWSTAPIRGGCSCARGRTASRRPTSRRSEDPGTA